MKRFGLFGALFAALALCATALVAVSAGAEETVWLCGERTIPRAKECLVRSENLEEFVLEDMGIPGRVECAVGSVLNEGWVGPGKEDETTSVIFDESTRNCSPSVTAENLRKEHPENQCLRVLGVKALNTPWKTELVLVGAETLDLILGSKGAEPNEQPGYETECEGLLGARVKDKCFAQPANTPLVTVENLRLEGTEFPLVDILFLQEPPERELEFGSCEANIVGNNPRDALVFGEVLLEAFLGGNPASLEWSEN